MSHRFPKTHEIIRAEFPGDALKPVRHELYRVVHSIPLNSKHPDSVPPGTTVSNYPYTTIDMTSYDTFTKMLSLQNIEKALADERLSMCCLGELVAKKVREFVGLYKRFTFYDVTKAVREQVNNSRLVLLDDREFEDLDVYNDGVMTLTQKIPHEEVKGLIQKLWDNTDALKGYYKTVRNGHYEFRPVRQVKPDSLTDLVGPVVNPSLDDAVSAAIKGVF